MTLMTIAVTSKNLFPIRLEKHKNPIKETKREAENKFEIEIKKCGDRIEFIDHVDKQS